METSLPGQGSRLHLDASVNVQEKPHDLVLFLSPCPHVTEHGVHGVHSSVCFSAEKTAKCHQILSGLEPCIADISLREENTSHQQLTLAL